MNVLSLLTNLFDEFTSSISASTTAKPTTPDPGR